jgi:hypothetical protein
MRGLRFPVRIMVAGLLLLSGANAADAQCTLPHALSNGQPPDATKVMANFNALVACFNVGGSSGAVQYNSGSGLTGIGPLGDGQLVIGSTGNPPHAQSLTAGTGITIANGPGNIAVSVTSGSPGTGFYRQVMSALPTATSTGLTGWVGQQGATFVEGPAGVSVDAPAGADSLRVRYGPAPAAPYKLTVLLAATRNSSAYSEAGIGWYDGSAKLHIISLVIGNLGLPPSLQVAKWSAYNFRVGNDAAAGGYFPQPLWLQLQDDGTNITFAYGVDGVNFVPLFTAPKSSAYLGASGYNNFILFSNPRGGETIATAMSWTVN